MPSIERRPTPHGPRYRVRVRLRGLRPLSRTFPTLHQARQWGITTESAWLTTRDFPGRDATRQTLTALIDRYRREVLPRRSPGTARNRTIQLAWWQQELGYLRLVDLTPARLVACREQLTQTRSPGTVNQYLVTLGHALAIAVAEWQWLEASPMRRVQQLRLPPPRTRYLTEAERPRLLAACQASAHRFLYPLVLLALSTGARKRELLTLTWADIDVRRRELCFHATKNRHPRIVPLTEPALTLMQAHAKVRRLDTPLVFPRRDGRAPVDIRYAWQQALKIAAIADFRWHDMRHTFASYSAMSGASLLDLQALLGHTTPAMTARYAHLSQGHLAGVVTRMTATHLA